MVQTTILREKNGVALQIVVNAGRPLQWSIYLLHLIELPFHHPFQQVDEANEVHNSFCRPFGQQLLECEALLVVAFDFESIDCATLDEDQYI